MNSPRKFSTREKIAAGISGGILVVIVIYWITQIVGVMEMLKLAYG
jgi:hypothetical protein